VIDQGDCILKRFWPKVEALTKTIAILGPGRIYLFVRPPYDESMRIVRQYLLTEILGLFALSLTIITVLFMSQRIIQLTEWAMNRGVGAADMGRFMLYLLPGVMVIIIPIVTLFSILLAVGRLSSDNEVTALKSAGISLYRLFPPALLFAVFTSCLALLASQRLVPDAARATRELRFRVLRTQTESAVVTKTFFDLLSRTTVYIRDRASDGSLLGVMAVMEKWPEDGTWKNRQSVFAERGRFVHDPVRLTNEMWLEDGVVTQDDRETGKEEFIGFTALRLKLEIGPSGKVKFDEVRAEMDLADMAAALAEPPPPKSKKKAAVKAGEPKPKKKPDAAAEPKKAKKSKKGKNTSWEQERLELSVQFHERIAFPLGCLALCFWALPLGIQPPRAGRARAVVVSILISGFFYYLMILAKFAALHGSVAPALAIWMPDLVITLTGVYMLRQKNNERPVLLVSRFEDWVWYTVDRIKARLKRGK